MQANRRKIGEIGGGGKDGLVVFTTAFLLEYLELKKFRVYREGAYTVFHKIDLAEGEDPTPISVRYVKGLQQHEDLTADVGDELRGQDADQKATTQSDIALPSATSNHAPCSEEPIGKTADEQVANRVIKSAGTYPMSRDPATLVNVKETSDVSEAQVSVNDYEQTEVSQFGAAFVVSKVYDDLNIDQCLLKAGVSKAAASKIKILVQKTIITRNFDDETADSFTKIHDVVDIPYFSRVPFCTLGKHISFDQIERFFDAYLTHSIKRYCVENNTSFIHITYDGSSISHTGKLSQAKYGHNKDGDKLPQFNVGMLCISGELTPVYMNYFQGHINDVIAVQSFIKRIAKCDLKNTNVVAVVDCGCYSESNINSMLNRSIDFIMHVPKYGLLKANCDGSSSVDFGGIKRLIEEEIEKGSFSLQSSRVFDCRRYSFATVTINQSYDPYPIAGLRKSKKEKDDLFLHVLFDHAKHDKAVKQTLDVCTLAIHKIIYGGYLTAHEEEVIKACSNYDPNLHNATTKEQPVVLDAKVHRYNQFDGFFVLMSSQRLTVEEVLERYKGRNTVEDSYQVLKNYLGFSRLGAKTEQGVDIALFIGFLATAVRCEMGARLNKLKAESPDLCGYDKLRSVNSLIEELSTPRVFVRSNKKKRKVFRDYQEVCDNHNLLFVAMNVAPPETSVSLTKGTVDQENVELKD